uniref:ARAD1D43252p n=1 Tax=Blastobotrys adeninivorans TaxID=409370 RepID=A0A060TCK5_BLAAD
MLRLGRLRSRMPAITRSRATQRTVVYQRDSTISDVNGTASKNKSNGNSLKIEDVPQTPKSKRTIDVIPSLNSVPSTPTKSKFRPSVPVEPLSNDVLGKYMEEFSKGLQYVLTVDPSLRPVIETSTFTPFLTETVASDTMTCFQHLARGICAQQVSGAAAKSILAKFVRLFYPDLEPGTELGHFPTPKMVREKPLDTLRSAGLSARKAEYIWGLAEAFSNGTISEEKLKTDDDDTVVDELVALKGLGPWSADMFLLFCLRRMDVFSIGDLGVQRGMANYIQQRPWIMQELKQVDWSIPLDGLHSPGKSSRAKDRKLAKTKDGAKSKWKVHDKRTMEWVAHQFRPYRSVFQMILWKLSSIDLDVLEKTKKEEASEDQEDSQNLSPENTSEKELW